MSLGYPIGGPHPNPLPDVDVNCTLHNGVPWVWHVFGECVVNQLQYAGFFLGLISILCWLVVFLPQFYDAFKHGKMDEAISPVFLFLWLLGDVSNLVGSLLSNQLGTQIAVAYYYIGMDCLVLLQFTYYFIKNRRKRRMSGELRVSYDSMAKPNRNQVIYCVGGLFLLASTTWFSLLPWRQGAVHPGSRATGRMLLGLENEPSTICKVTFLNTRECMFYSDTEIIGYACGCVSAFFYLASRVPQLYKNYKRKSVEGVAIMMFILTVLGNVFYGLSILLEDTSVVFILRHLPWLVGSLGTLCFDCVMLLQFRLYGRRPSGYVGLNEDESRGLLTPKVRSDDEGFYRPALEVDT
ncbi:lysosomal amino acid transporter 1 homolog [Acanthaster planci]|uniref:Lysosomal amino acid transporter 1 homolog n=1 Tax=Acanthaster planci TaxID=133434 RepID=A0A8B7ZEV5_ACAPL|nr:lysosomal amino acid transporter 1 homolog [Acanthaster planci]